MYYTKIDIKIKGRLPVHYDEKGLRISWDFHAVANKLYEQWNHRRCVFLYRRIIHRREFILHAASKEQEDMKPFAKAFMEQFGGESEHITVTRISQNDCEEALAHAIFMGYLRNGKEICASIQSETEQSWDLRD